MIQLINKSIINVEDGLIVCNGCSTNVLNIAVKQKYPDIESNTKWFEGEKLGGELGSCFISGTGESDNLAVAFLYFMDENEITQFDKLKESLQRLKEIVGLAENNRLSKIIFPYGLGCDKSCNNWGKVMQLIEIFAEQVDKEVVLYTD